MLDDLEYVLHDAVSDCIIYLLQIFFSFAATIVLVSAFSTSNVSQYNWHASLIPSFRRRVLWILMLLGMRSGAIIKGI